MRRPNHKITIYYLLTGRLPQYFSGLLPEAVVQIFVYALYLPFLFWRTFHCIPDILPKLVSCTEMKFSPNIALNFFWITYTICTYTSMDVILCAKNSYTWQSTCYINDNFFPRPIRSINTQRALFAGVQ